MFIKVVLPEPDAPISATISPRSMVSDTPSKHRDFHLAEVVGLVDIFQPDQFHICSLLGDG